jgi:hypothetical protein
MLSGEAALPAQSKRSLFDAANVAQIIAVGASGVLMHVTALDF